MTGYSAWLGRRIRLGCATPQIPVQVSQLHYERIKDPHEAEKMGSFTDSGDRACFVLQPPGVLRSRPGQKTRDRLRTDGFGERLADGLHRRDESGSYQRKH